MSEARRVYEPDYGNVLYFKRVASPLFSDYAAADRGEYSGPWQVVRQTGTARVDPRGPNAHRTVLASFLTEEAADDFIAERVTPKRSGT